MCNPYIEVSFRPDTPIETGRFNRRGPGVIYSSGFHAKFAALVVIPTFESAEPRKEGFSAKDFKTETMARQVVALRNLQEGICTAGLDTALCTLSLRISKRFTRAGLVFCLIGKAFAPSADLARRRVITLFDYTRAFISTDYSVRPAVHLSEYIDWTRDDLLQGESLHDKNFAEVMQKEELVARPLYERVTDRAYILHPFHASLHGMEDVWQSLSRWEEDAIISMTLRPASPLYENEVYGLADLQQRASKLADTKSLRVQMLVKASAQHYANLVEQLRHPFAMRVNVIARRSVYQLACAVGNSLTLREGTLDPIEPAYKIYQPQDRRQVQILKQNLCRLEMDEWTHSVAPLPYRRLRNLVSPEVAQTGFRFPLPPKGGWSGTTFVS